MQSVLALVIVVYVSIKLTDLTYEVGTNEISGQCFLGTNTYDLSFSSNNCLMLQILGGLTIGLGIVIGIIQCYTCYLCGLGGVLDGLFGLAGAGAWGAAAGIIEHAVESDGSLSDAASERISSSGLADEVSSLNSERDTVRIMCWVEFGFFCFLVFTSLLKCCPGRNK